MENMTQLIIAIATLVGTVGALIPTIVTLLKFFKKNIKNKNWDIIIAFAKEAVIAAEKSGASGANKKQMVIDSVKASCASAGIEVNEEELDRLSSSIDDLISWYNEMKKKNTTTKKKATKAVETPSVE